MTTTRDPDQQRTYDAEAGWAAGLARQTFDQFESVEALVGDITCSDYWQRRCGQLWPVIPTVADGRQRNAYGGWMEEGYQIDLPRWAWRPDVILHELAHVAVLLGPCDGMAAGHGIEYRREMLALVTYVLGADHAGRLAAAYTAQGLLLPLPDPDCDPTTCTPFDGLAVERIGGAIAL